MIGFLVAYIIAVVPVNYAIVTRLGRRELAWLTTPAIIAIFFAGAYGLGLSMRGSRTMVSRLAVLELQPGQTLARARGYVGVFSPAKLKYDLALEGTAAAATATDAGDEPLRLVYGARPMVADLAVNMWSSRVLQVEFLADLNGGIDGYLEYDGSDFRAHVRNNSDLRLERVALVQQGRMGQPVTLMPGQEQDLSFIHTTQIGSSTGGNVALADAALEELFGSSPGPPWSVAGLQMFVVAICSERLVPVELIDRPARTEDATVIVLSLPTRLRPGKGITVPSGRVSRRLVETDGSVSHSSGPEDWITIEQGSITIEYTVPRGPQGGTVQGLSLTLATNTGRGAVTEVSVRDAVSGAWTRLTLSGDQATIPQPARYMTADGRVTVKVEATSGPVVVTHVELSATMDAL